MTTAPLEDRCDFLLEHEHRKDLIQQAIHTYLPRFDRILKKIVWFHLFFLSLLVVECTLSLILFQQIARSSLLALSFATIFLTLFAYSLLKLYLHTRKMEKLKQFIDSFTDCCQQLIKYKEDVPKNLIALANAYSRLASTLQGRQWRYWTPPRLLFPLRPTLERLSCWLHWEDLHHIREWLLQHAIDEHIKLIACQPTNLEAHAALANAYVMLSTLYMSPREEEERSFIPSNQWQKRCEEKFRKTAHLAIEEFKILNDYAPNDPWIHRQLAYSYSDLQMPEEEIHEYELLLSLNSKDFDSLYKLGKLYFQQGQNAQGLRIYERLKHTYPKKAKALIDAYASKSLSSY